MLPNLSSLATGVHWSASPPPRQLDRQLDRQRYEDWFFLFPEGLARSFAERAQAVFDDETQTLPLRVDALITELEVLIEIGWEAAMELGRGVTTYTMAETTGWQDQIQDLTDFKDRGRVARAMGRVSEMTEWTDDVWYMVDTWREALGA